MQDKFLLGCMKTFRIWFKSVVLAWQLCNKHIIANAIMFLAHPMCFKPRIEPCSAPIPHLAICHTERVWSKNNASWGFSDCDQIHSLQMDFMMECCCKPQKAPSISHCALQKSCHWSILLQFNGIPIIANLESCMEPGQLTTAALIFPSGPETKRFAMQWSDFHLLQKWFCLQQSVAHQIKNFQAVCNSICLSCEKALGAWHWWGNPTQSCKNGVAIMCPWWAKQTLLVGGMQLLLLDTGQKNPVALEVDDIGECGDGASTAGMSGAEMAWSLCLTLSSVGVFLQSVAVEHCFLLIWQLKELGTFVKLR